MKIFTYIKEDSNRIKRKNFRKIGTLELWKHLIYELVDLGQDIYIDTDSKEVIEQCSKDPILRDVYAYPRNNFFIEMENDYSNKLSPALLMLENFLDIYVEDGEETIVLIHVTSPFLKKETLQKAVEIYENSDYDYVHSVKKEKDFAFLGSFKNPINFNPLVVQRTQDLEPIYFSNGAFFIFSKNIFKKNNNRWGNNIHFFPLNHVEAMEIDDPSDLDFARIIYQGLK